MNKVHKPVKMPSKDRACAAFAYCDVWKRGVALCVGPLDMVNDCLADFGMFPLTDAELRLIGENHDDKKHWDATTHLKECGNILIWARHRLSIPCLVHECVHASSFILESANANDSDEARAYLTEFLFTVLSDSASCG